MGFFSCDYMVISVSHLLDSSFINSFRKFDHFVAPCASILEVFCVSDDERHEYYQVTMRNKDFYIMFLCSESF